MNQSFTPPAWFRLETLGKQWAILFLLFEIVFFSLLQDTFFTLRNGQEILIASTTILLLAVGQSYVIITGGIDLSVGFVMGFASVISAKWMVFFSQMGFPELTAVGLGILITLLIGLIPGLFNGLLVAQFRVPPFIATFSMYGITYGVSEIIMAGIPVTRVPGLASNLGNGFLMYWIPDKIFAFLLLPDGIPRRDLRQLVEIFPNLLLILIPFLVISHFVLKNTRFGQYTYAIGGNIEASRRAGINVKAHLIQVYMFSSFCASTAGIMYLLKFVTGKADAGSGRMLDAVVAVVIGGASLYGGVGTIRGAVIGALIIAVLETGLRILGIPSFNIYILVGVILIFAVLLDQLLKRTQ